MKILFVSLFSKPVFILVLSAEPGPGALSKRLAALRAWPSRLHERKG